jgi:hypothetical protein
VTPYISELQRAIRNLHGCESKHVESVSVTETFQGRVLWKGKVEVFELSGHPQAKRAYAWAYVDENKQSQYVTVLHVPPVDSPQRAVKAMIATRMKAAR